MVLVNLTLKYILNQLNSYNVIFIWQHFNYKTFTTGNNIFVVRLFSARCRGKKVQWKIF